MVLVTWLLALTLSGPVIVSGQSNALELAPRLARYHEVIGHQRGGQSIAFWAPTAEGWRRLSAAISGRSDAEAFIWCQGESDAAERPAAVAKYRDALADLIRRVRNLTRQNLPVYLCELGPAVIHEPINAQINAYVALDPQARIIRTRDLPFQLDQLHPTDVGYDLLVQRIRRALRKHEKGHSRA